MKAVSLQDYAIALYQATHGVSGVEREKVLSAFVALLYKAGKLKQAEKIINAFIHYCKKQDGILDITITTARAIDATTLSHIKKAFGEKVEALTTIDPDMIGGVKIKTESTILDGSIRTQLTLLKQQLT